MPTCLLVVADAASPTGGDADLKSRLETTHGYTVTYRSDSDAEPGTTFDLYVIAESVLSGDVGTKYRDIAKPLLHLEPFAWDDHNYCTATNLATHNDSDLVNLVKAVGPATGMTTGSKDITTAATGGSALLGSVPKADLASGATTYIERNGDSTRAIGAYFESGATLTTGTAAARRVALGILDPAYDLATSDLHTLFDKAIEWLEGPAEVSQRLAPDTIASSTNLSGAVTDIDDDPDTPDAAWLTAPGSNNNTDVRTTFPTPASDLITGAGKQEFRVQVRKTNHSTNPTARIELWENGALVATVLADTAVSSTTGTVLSGTWNASQLTQGTGANVECKVVGTVGGGNPGNRASLEVGAIEWNAKHRSTAVTGTVGQAPETDTAQAVSGAKAAAVAQAVETDTAQPVTARKSVVLAQAAEAGTAQPVTARRSVTAAQAAESSTALPVTARKSLVLEQAAEAGTAQAVSAGKSVVVGQAAEAGTAQPVTARRSLREAAEASTAQPVVRGAVEVSVAQAAETDTARAVTAAKAKTVEQAAEAGTAEAVSAGKSVTVGQAAEASTAQPVTGAKAAAVAQALSSSTAQPVGTGKTVTVGQAAEASTAQPVTARRSLQLGQAVGVDTAQAVTAAKAKTVEQAAEASTAQPVGRLKVLGVAQAAELSAAHALGALRSLILGQAAEADAAHPVDAVVVGVGGGSSVGTVDPAFTSTGARTGPSSDRSVARAASSTPATSGPTSTRAASPSATSTDTVG